MGERTTVVTVVHGRHDHLREQVRVLRRVAPAVHHVVVAIDDAEVPVILDQAVRTTVLEIGTDPLGLPVAAGRNAGVERALSDGAARVVLLDVDCVPGPRLVSRYVDAFMRAGDALLCGPVTYLHEGQRVPDDPDDLAGLRAPHPARPDPADGSVLRRGDPDLFWSLSCALSAPTWRRIGGFHEGYVGYGAEDTDFGRLARSRGVDLVWVGGADAFHQFHPVSTPPVEHVADIVRNATLFHRRWGEWPMRGWLGELDRSGLVSCEPDRLVLRNPSSD
ncbi:glycosyltransferase family 2 protein [Knoellia sp. CPCC 206450]|uniref:glycosyltransferase family 2 protein n=1 Tax=Knoellia tibetensis TaxID=3404798 RepID=UPI003B428E24